MSKSKSYQVPEAAPSLVADMLKRLEELALLKEGWDEKTVFLSIQEYKISFAES